MQQENKNFNKGEEEKGPNHSPGGQTPGDYQQPTPKVDNFSAPPEGGETGESDSFKMPSSEELKDEETPSKPEEKQTIKTSPAYESEEPEDVFAAPPKTPPPSPQQTPSVESAKPEPEPTPQPQAPEPESPEQKLNIEPAKKGHGCLWGIIIAIIIILLLAGAIFVNEMGIIDLGIEKYYGAIHLEKLWGGLPSDAKAAIALSAKKMKDKSFNLEGSSQINLTVEGEMSSTSTTSSSTGENVQGIEATTTSGTQNNITELIKKGIDFKGEVTLKASYQSPDKFEINFSTPTSGSDQVASLLGLGETFDLTLINDGNNVYLKNVDLNKILNLDKEWVKIIIPRQEGTVSNKTTASNLISSGERTGSERVQGVSSYVYEVKMSGIELQNYLVNYRPNFAWLAKNISFSSVKFYLGKRDHLMHKIEVSFSNISNTSTIKNKLTLVFSNIGGAVAINIPPSDAVAEKNWTDVKNVFVQGTTTPTPTPSGTPEERDKQRKSDLKKIQDALLAYKVQNGKYPSTNGAIEKTKDPTSNLKTALVPKFLDSLPVDPETDKYYYGYKSDDGTKCEIWSILENKNDPDGEDYQGYWIYKLRGN